MIVNIAKKIQIRVYISRIEKRNGVCSKVYKKDEHILLWDFDNEDLSSVIGSLKAVQALHDLPQIYIIKSSEMRYHAYCFVSRTLQEVIHILSGTWGVDLEYLRMGMVRGYYTLRFSPRKGENFELVRTLKSHIPDEINPLEVTVNQYYTTNKGGENAKR